MTNQATTSQAGERELLPGQEDLFGALLPPGIKFGTIGEVHIIRVAGVQALQDRDFDSGNLLTWDDGRAKMVSVIYGPVDGGEPGSWWIRGKRAVQAVREAAREAGVRGFAIGDEVLVTRGPDEEVPPKSGRGATMYANTWDVTIVPADQVTS